MRQHHFLSWLFLDRFFGLHRFHRLRCWLEPKRHCLTAPVARWRWFLVNAADCANRAFQADMQVVLVPIPGPHFPKPCAVARWCHFAKFFLDDGSNEHPCRTMIPGRQLDQPSDTIIEFLIHLGRPAFRHDGIRAPFLAFIPGKLVVRCGAKPDVCIKAALMTAMARLHWPPARLRHVTHKHAGIAFIAHGLR